MGFQCKDLGVTYKTQNGELEALTDVSFSVRDHEFVCLVGPSGCGKSTILKLVAGLLEPTLGTIAFDTVPANGRPRNAMVFQEHGVFPWMNVIDNVAFGLEIRGVPREERRAIARRFIARVGLSHFEESHPHELSVGMRQRVSIARAFVNDPEILLMDEPFGSLDAMTKMVMTEELMGIWSRQRKQVLYVTHDIEEAIMLGDRILVMTGRPGRIREEIEIRLPRPRDLRDRDSAEIVKIKEHVWEILEEEVRSGLREGS
ncbi:MAG: ABC transporter ATP-binding protein [Gemmatimonadetes bacterium]|nr:ABC transporter ATP-binding protein [Gemmatimonadota bacterium]